MRITKSVVFRAIYIMTLTVNFKCFELSMLFRDSKTVSSIGMVVLSIPKRPPPVASTHWFLNSKKIPGVYFVTQDSYNVFITLVSDTQIKTVGRPYQTEV